MTPLSLFLLCNRMVLHRTVSRNQLNLEYKALTLPHIVYLLEIFIQGNSVTTFGAMLSHQKAVMFTARFFIVNFL